MLGCVHHNRLSLQIAGNLRPIPDWANWLIWLGAWTRCQAAMDGRRVVVVRLPSRRLSAAFVCLGMLLVASRLHDDALDWEALQALPNGTTVHWRDPRGGKSKRYTGTVDSVREIGGDKYLAISIAPTKIRPPTTFLLPRSTALTYGVTLGVITQQINEQLTAAARLYKSVVDGASQSWIRSPAADSTVVTERTSFLEDLSELALVGGQSGVVNFDEALAIAGVTNQQHGKLQLVPSRERLMKEAPDGVTVLDGAAASMCLGSSRSRSVVLLLDYSEYDDELVNVISPFLGCSIDAGIHVPATGVLRPPDGVEVFVFGLPDNSGVGA